MTPGAHVLKVRAEIRGTAAHVVRGVRWQGGASSLGQPSETVVAERLILFRICPLSMAVEKLQWAPGPAAAREAPLEGQSIGWSAGTPLRSQADMDEYTIGDKAGRVRLELAVAANCGGVEVAVQDGIQVDFARVDVRRRSMESRVEQAGSVPPGPLADVGAAASSGGPGGMAADTRHAFADAGGPVEVDLPSCIPVQANGCVGQEYFEVDVRIQDREHVEVVLTFCKGARLTAPFVTYINSSDFNPGSSPAC